jgi:hypothetical protein
MSELPTKEEIKAYLTNATRLYGEFEVGLILAKVANEASEEYKAAGNHGAVVHKDARALNNCMVQMMGHSPLRFAALAP